MNAEELHSEDLVMPGKVWSYITDTLEKEGACHFSLLDPDPLKNNDETLVQMATLVEKAGSDAIMIGGSTIFGNIDETVKAISDAAEIPTILFPGNLNGVSGNADAMFFMSFRKSCWQRPRWKQKPATPMLCLITTVTRCASSGC
jgi:heptaprenylglyceryl phosphate synthase